MAKCIICGAELEILTNYPEILGYKCSNCNLQWTLAEHKDNQNWAVRHIRALEAQVKELSESILVLQKKVLS
jgi:hypothetical protein